jgi:hypothetical protein
MESVATDKQIIESLSVVEWPVLAQSGRSLLSVRLTGRAYSNAPVAGP